MKKAYFNWSGGKDSALALYRALQSGEYEVSLLFSAVKKGDACLAMHETGVDLLKKQAASIGIPLVVWEWDPASPVEEYRAAMGRQVAQLREMGIETALFGDLYLEELRAHREKNCAASGMEAAFPLWGMGAEQVMGAFVASGFKGVVTCVDGAVLGEGFLGRAIDEEFLRDLPPGADICGENGEYHSFVFDGPIFQAPVPFCVLERGYREYPDPAGTGTHRFWHCRLA